MIAGNGSDSGESHGHIAPMIQTQIGSETHTTKKNVIISRLVLVSHIEWWLMGSGMSNKIIDPLVRLEQVNASHAEWILYLDECAVYLEDIEEARLIAKIFALDI